MHQKGVKTSFFSWSMSSLGRTSPQTRLQGGFRGGGVGGGGGGVQKSCSQREKRVEVREGATETWHQDSSEHWALETANKGRSASPPPPFLFFFFCISRRPSSILPDHSYSDNRKVCGEALFCFSLHQGAVKVLDQTERLTGVSDRPRP